MEAIKTYLETMFAHLPRTPEVTRAKTELGQMMEDKYNELIEEGKSENEAVGIVISEFGNLEEVAEELGIRSFVDQEPAEEAQRVVSFEEVDGYIKGRTRLSYMGAFGIFFLIISSVPFIILSGIPVTAGGGPAKFFAVVGLILLFLMLAGGLGMLIFSGLGEREYSYMWKENCRLDYSAQEYVKMQYSEYRSTHTILIIVGIVLCILSALPAAIFSFLQVTNGFFGNIAGAVCLFLVGAAVFLFVLAGRQRGGLGRLLKVQYRADQAQQEGAESSQKNQGGPEDVIIYENEYLSKFMPVYWPTIPCLYLVVSFLTFRWGTTWIIWPVAGIVHAFISKTFGKHVFEA